MTLFDGSEEHPPAKIRRYIITTIAFVLLVAGACWYLLRYHQEKSTINRFMKTVAAGQMDVAYKIWQPSSSYSLKDFNEDWGSEGYYGPVKSFRILAAHQPNGGSGVEVKVVLSPYDPYPAENDAVKQSKTKEVTLWVEFKDQSISFPP
ncbi:MAG: hypothetical protein ACRD59_08520 [Candidatus Acidiferrales bacterium]